MQEVGLGILSKVYKACPGTGMPTVWSCARTGVGLRQRAEADWSFLSCLGLCSGSQRRCETLSKAAAGNVDFTSPLMRRLRVIFRTKPDKKILRPVLSEAVSSLLSSS